MAAYTKEEQFLINLANNSFFKFWSWPNLFRNQLTNGKGDGKEICDLIVIFGNSVLLFSDKKIEFNTKIKDDVAWCRWARQAIGDSVKQIKGARRWLINYPERIFLDKDCKTPLPAKIPSHEAINFHNIVVCHGIENVLSHFNNEASFIFDNTIKNQDNWSSNSKPFRIGQIFEGDFVHVFNEATIDLVLREFDTVSDFIDYLSKRKELLCRSEKTIINTEAAIVQLYYENTDSIIPKEFINKDLVLISAGGITDLYANPSFIMKKRADEDSYFFDSLIENLSFHISNKSITHKNWNFEHEAEPSVRYLAALNRFERRIISTAFIEFYYHVPVGMRGSRLCFRPDKNSDIFLFLALPDTGYFSDFDSYTKKRRELLYDHSMINKYLFPSAKVIFAFGFKTRSSNNPITSSFFSEGHDFLFTDFSDWTSSDNDEAKRLHDFYLEHGLIKDKKITTRETLEFPESPSKINSRTSLKGRERNKSCICGSGIKYKKCCGKN